MSALTLSGTIFGLTLAGIFLGTLLRRSLPEHHLNEHAKDVVRLGVGLIATIAALVLGLLIASAKDSFDRQTSQIRKITADLILLDNILAQYGPEARPVRERIRTTVGPFADRLWREKESRSQEARLSGTVPRNKSTWKFRSFHPRTMSNARSNRARYRSATRSHKRASCCLSNPKIGSEPVPRSPSILARRSYSRASACSPLST